MSQLSRYSIQSTSDQMDYKMNAIIASAVNSLVTPEQGAVWSYPLKNGDKEEVICNMVNAILGRIHQSGHLAEISEESFKYIQEGIKYYKKIKWIYLNSYQCGQLEYLIWRVNGLLWIKR